MPEIGERKEFMSTAKPSHVAIATCPELRVAGLGEFLQTGHEPFSRNHSSMQSAWKQCRQSGMHLIVSLGR